MDDKTTRRGVRIDRLEGALSRLRSKARLLLLARGAALIVAIGLGSLLAVGMLDYFLRLPATLRWIVWIAGVVALVFGVRAWIRPALGFRPSLRDLAMRVESTQGKRPGGWLASALELDPSDARSREAIQLADEKLAEIGPWHVLEPSRSARFGLGLSAAVVFALLTLVIAPTLSRIGAERALAPWSSVSWPKRTQVTDATSSGEVHPLGVSLDLAVHLTKTPAAAGQAQVVAMVRFVEDGRASETLRLPMTARADGTAQNARELFQRRVKTPEQAEGELSLEYWFESLDDSTKPRTIRLAPTPEIASAEIQIAPPAYASKIVAANDQFFDGSQDLGTGVDARAIAGPILAGSSYELRIALNKPVDTFAEGGESPPWLNDLLAASTNAQFDLQGDALTVTGSIVNSARIEVSLQDEHGLVNSLASAFSFDVLQDAEPTASVTEPSHDEGVLATAVLDIAGEATDDVALQRLALEHQVARPPQGSEGAPPEPSVQTTIIAMRTLEDEPPASRARASVGVQFDLSSLSLVPGDELWISTVASDIYAYEGVRHDPARSKVRRLLIIAEEQLVDGLRRDLDSIREAARRLDDAQARVERQIDRLGSSAGAREQQASIGEQVQAQREAAERIAQRMQRNRLDDQALEGLVSDAAGALDAAAQAASEAANAIEQGVAQDEEPGENPEREREIEEAQREVRDELGRLAEMLSRGQDEWLMRRGVERLLNEQRRLAEQTEAIGQSTAGRSASDLSAQELSELDRIAQRQREAAEELEQTLDELNERSRQLSEVDPSQSAAMQQAADRGRRSQAQEAMQDAAQQVQQNQTGSAAQNQQEAIDALEDMIEDLDSATRNRDAALQRMLASVIESLEGLIKQQERELAALDQAVANGFFDDLDQGMVRLFTNSLGVHDQVRAQGADTEPVTDLLDQAISAQEEAIAALRAKPVDEPSARVSEQASLARLKEAKAEASRIQEEAAARDQARKLAELRGIYRDALEQQVALRAETEPMADQRLNRRDRQSARTLGEQQDTLRIMLQELRESNEEFDDAAMFDFAHQRLDALMDAAAEDLRNGAPTGRTIRQQNSSIRILQSVIEAIKDAESQDNPFRDAAGGESGGQSGGQGGSGEDEPLLPPAAELKLLRAMQTEALDWTRALDEAGNADSSELEELGKLQNELQTRGEELVQKLFQNQQGGLPNIDKEDQR